MPRRTALALAALLLLAAGAAAVLLLGRGEPGAPPPGAGAPRVALGLSGERPEAFGDPRLRALGLRLARVQASWDLLLRSGDAARFPGLADERERLARWLRAAPRAGVREVLLAVKPSRDRPRELPSPAAYERGVRALLGWIDAQGAGGLVRAVSPMNEPDLVAPTRSRPRAAGAMYATVRRLCAARGCLAVAGDFHDRAWTPAYLEEYRRGAGGAPAVWGWHAYEDAWRRADDPTMPRLRAFLRRLGPQARVWLTEQGGIVRRGRPASDGRIAQAPDAAAADLRFLLARAPAVDPRIRRFYVYQWRGEPPPLWDSGLIAPDGRTRPSYCAMAAAAGRPAAARAARC